jgi:putative flippase GtrA
MGTDYKKTFNQFWRFVIIGVINTVIDYAILLILSKLTGITGGSKIIPLNITSFTVATINSYYLNKHWAFADQSRHEQGKKFSLFLIVSIIGVTLNTTIVTLITSHISPMFGLPPRVWLIGSKLVATAASLVWNFVGYKIIVFKK